MARQSVHNITGGGLRDALVRAIQPLDHHLGSVLGSGPESRDGSVQRGLEQFVNEFAALVDIGEMIVGRFVQATVDAGLRIG